MINQNECLKCELNSPVHDAIKRIHAKFRDPIKKCFLQLFV